MILAGLGVSLSVFFYVILFFAVAASSREVSRAIGVKRRVIVTVGTPI